MRGTGSAADKQRSFGSAHPESIRRLLLHWNPIVMTISSSTVSLEALKGVGTEKNIPRPNEVSESRLVRKPFRESACSVDPVEDGGRPDI
jgi:hypothetical protein